MLGVRRPVLASRVYPSKTCIPTANPTATPEVQLREGRRVQGRRVAAIAAAAAVVHSASDPSIVCYGYVLHLPGERQGKHVRRWGVPRGCKLATAFRDISTHTYMSTHTYTGRQSLGRTHPGASGCATKTADPLRGRCKVKEMVYDALLCMLLMFHAWSRACTSMMRRIQPARPPTV